MNDGLDGGERSKTEKENRRALYKMHLTKFYPTLSLILITFPHMARARAMVGPTTQLSTGIRPLSTSWRDTSYS